MADGSSGRRLAAILAADVAGYSRMMGEDEGGTHARLKSLRREFIEPIVAAHGGRIVKLAGDSALAEFESVVGAVLGAIEVQRGVAERNVTVPQERRILFRIGINLGDIIRDEGDIYGDGVNIAARLEALAEPGGICVSDVVHQTVRATQPHLAFADLGLQQVKNIARPLRVWRWIPDGAPLSAQLEPVQATPAHESRPAVVVLPFNNMSGDTEQEYFSDGITEDLITDLSQLSGLSVIARHSSFRYKGQQIDLRQLGRELAVRYALEGSVRRSGDRVRINAQLIDCEAGYHLWAQRYDRQLVDIFAVQDEIAAAIVAALEVALTSSERQRLARRYTASLEAYDLFLKARESQLRRTREGLAEARRYLEQALRVDPAFAGAYALLSDNYRQEWIFGWREDPDVLERALELARTAVGMDDTLPLAHVLLGWIYAWRQQHEQAIDEARKGLALDPNSAEGCARLGHILDLAGRPEEAIPLIQTARRLDPHGPFLYPFFLGHAYQSLESYEEAIAAYQVALGHNPDHIGTREHLAAIYGLLGRDLEARAEAAEVLRLSPKFSIAREAQKMPYRDGAVLNRLIDGLSRAGLPA